ncbi:hypothetical protein RJ639_020229 [Escallonia herrerae]|uniref:RING-type E3 ubiquitin transferase n=1 Tax=Escallonia herrerae TaxID=1293975 RepID=A0AA89AIZ2_9ASTE|nr:hypothetical protein RJ639_020229 [Escallonia herrerae]
MEGETIVKEKLQEMQKQLGKKQMFEEAVSSIAALLRQFYPSASPSLRKSVCNSNFLLKFCKKICMFLDLEFTIDNIAAAAAVVVSATFTHFSISRSCNYILTLCYSFAEIIVHMLQFYSVVCRVATILKTRYTAPGFWKAGLGLFLEAEHLMHESSEKEYLRSCIAQAQQQLIDLENQSEGLMSSQNRATRGFLFEGHLTVDREPPQPDWLVQSNLLASVATLFPAESSRDLVENNNTSEDAANLLNELVERFDNIVPMNGTLTLALRQSAGRCPVLDQSMAAILPVVLPIRFPDYGNQPWILENDPVAPRAPPASKEVVRKLPVTTITEEIFANLSPDAECAICKENLVVSDKMQELPCKHMFHPPCLKPWLDEHNSCPICRHELQTDDHAYESWKEREKDAEEERRGAANALRGGEYMYV